MVTHAAISRTTSACSLHSQVVIRRDGNFLEGDFGGVRRLHFNE